MDRARQRMATAHRRGNYHLIMTLFMGTGMTLAALAVDLSWMRLARTECQAVADAAANAALIELRRTGDPTAATAAAEEFVSRNVVGSSPPELLDLEFGRWDENHHTLLAEDTCPHAVRAVVGRPSSNPLSLYFTGFVGPDTFTVSGESVAATRSMQVVLVMDITGSFASDIGSARTAALQFLDLLEATHGQYDMVGMSLFYNRFGIEYTPLEYLDDEMYSDTARDAWGRLDTASKPNLFGFLYGGYHPDMPREYPDEHGTDHHTGIEMAIQMFEEHPDPQAFKAMVILTDGRPSPLETPTDRASAGYTETRWNQYSGPTPYSTTQIREATLAATDRAWTDDQINVWSISYGAEDPFLVDMTQGVGKFYYTEHANQLPGIFADIASSLPIATVR